MKMPQEGGGARLTCAGLLVAAILAAPGFVLAQDAQTRAPEAGPGATSAEPAGAATSHPPTPSQVVGEQGVTAERKTRRTVEDVQAAIDEANKRRDALLRTDEAVAGPESRKAFKDKWGVEVFGVWTAARGYMIDFHFRVIDVDKALPLFDPRINPYLVPEGTSLKLPVSAGEKVGAFRTTNRGGNIQANRDYHIVFGNPDAYVKTGKKVSVVIGEFRANDLTLR